MHHHELGLWLRHAGGAAGAVSRITGTIGKGIAALTMDEEYQRRRRLDQNRRPDDIAEGLAQGGRDLVMVPIWLSLCPLEA